MPLPPDFSPMLAATGPKNFSTLPLSSMCAEPKFDGVRGIISDNRRAYSRKLIELPNRLLAGFIAQFPELAFTDGEFTVGPPDHGTLRRTTSVVMSEWADITDVVFNVFDCFADPSAPFYVRADEARARVKGLHPQIKFVEPLYFNIGGTRLPVHQHALEYEDHCLEEGYEGMILRHIQREYKFGRSTLNQVRECGLVKIKRIFDAEAEVVGWAPLTTNQNEQTRDNLGYAKRSHAKAGKVTLDRLGTLLCRCPLFTKDFSVYIPKVLDQIELWNVRNSLKGRIIKFKYQPHGVKDAPRNPIFLAFRLD